MESNMWICEIVYYDSNKDPIETRNDNNLIEYN